MPDQKNEWNAKKAAIKLIEKSFLSLVCLAVMAFGFYVATTFDKGWGGWIIFAGVVMLSSVIGYDWF